MLAALEPPPFSPTTGAPAATSEVSWADIGKTALLDILRGLTGGTAAAEVASKIGGALGSNDAAAAAAAQRAAAAQQQKQTLMILGGIAGAVVLGALLLRR